MLFEIYLGLRNNDSMLLVLLAERPVTLGCHFALSMPDRIGALKGQAVGNYPPRSRKGRRSWTALLPVPGLWRSGSGDQSVTKSLAE
jgi:hypothetical protein